MQSSVDHYQVENSQVHASSSSPSNDSSYNQSVHCWCRSTYGATDFEYKDADNIKVLDVKDAVSLPTKKFSLEKKHTLKSKEQDLEKYVHWQKDSHGTERKPGADPS